MVWTRLRWRIGLNDVFNVFNVFNALWCIGFNVLSRFCDIELLTVYMIYLGDDTETTHDISEGWHRHQNKQLTGSLRTSIPPASTRSVRNSSSERVIAFFTQVLTYCGAGAHWSQSQTQTKTQRGLPSWATLQQSYCTGCSRAYFFFTDGQVYRQVGDILTNLHPWIFPSSLSRHIWPCTSWWEVSCNPSSFSYKQ